MSTLEQYFEYDKLYTKQYGPNTIILMQIGSFYEMYQMGILDHNKNIIAPAKIQDLARNLDIILTQRNNGGTGLGNAYMCGFPDYKLDVYKDKLVRKGYTLVIVSQITSPPKPERKVMEVITPGTYIDDTLLSNCIIGMHIEKYIKNHKNINIYGFAVIDILTGNVTMYETNSDEEAYRFITTYEPREIIYQCDFDSSEIMKFLELERYNKHSDSEKITMEFCKQYIRKVYDLGCIRELNQNTDNLLIYRGASIALTLLFKFINTYHSSTINNLKFPVIEKPSNTLILTHNTIKQLDLIKSDENNNSNLLTIIDKTHTMMGKRLLRDRLLHPSCDIGEINRRLDIAEEAIPLVDKLVVHLRKIIDLDYKYRRIRMLRLQPSEFKQIDLSLESVLNIAKICKKTKLLSNIVLSNNTNITESIKNIQKFYNEKFQLDKMDLSDSFIQDGIYPKIDKLQEIIKDCLKKYKKLIKLINTKIECSIELKYNEIDKYHLRTAVKKGKEIKEKFPDFVYKFNKTDCKINSSDIVEIGAVLKNARDKLDPLLKKAYLEILDEFMNTYQTDLYKINDYIAIIDVAVSSAKFTETYTRPILIEPIEESYEPIADDFCISVRASKMRHPIVEKIIDTKYVSNDIEAGAILLYGPNMAGKSTYMRALGLNVILAQMGMFVAAKKFELCPFKKLMTRIVGSDNQAKGMSKFMIEMTESKLFLEDADQHTLVLGDEICSGTEHSSAIGLVAASICSLIKKRACFLFATHLHELTEIDEIAEIIKKGRLYIKHAKFHVSSCDNLSLNCHNSIPSEIHSICDGQGPKNYGIEIAKVLGLPFEFLELASEIRNRLDNTDIVSNRPSHFNTKFLMTECSTCGSRKDLHTHHKIGQCTANKNGYVTSIDDRSSIGKDSETFHKNELHNLIVLCKKCHVKIHTMK